MRRSELNDEVNIIEVFMIIWKKKWKLISFVILTLVLMYFYQYNENKKPIKLTSISEIKPITYFDETKYSVYNYFLDQIKPSYIEIENNFINNEYYGKNNLPDPENRSVTVKQYSNVNQKPLISKIDKRYLYNLFVDKISQKSILVDLIKEFNYFDKEEYPNKKNYEDELIKFVYTIEIVKDENRPLAVSIKHETINLQKWLELLKFLEKKINNQIQSDISSILNDFLNYSQKIKKFTIEDIDLKLAAIQNEDEKNFLNQKKEIIKENRYVERMQETLSNSIVNSDDFYAAKLVYVSSDDVKKRVSIFKMLAVTGLLSLILGIFVILIAHAIRNRR